MRNKLIYKYIGRVLIGFSFLLIIPFLVGLLFKERAYSFVFCSIITFGVGLLLSFMKVEDKKLFARDGFKIVTLSWILISAIGAIPLMLDTGISYVDAFFEAVS